MTPHDPFAYEPSAEERQEAQHDDDMEFYYKILKWIDELEKEVTHFEANFLESNLANYRALSGRQIAIVLEMAKKYLPADYALYLIGSDPLL